MSTSEPGLSVHNNQTALEAFSNSLVRETHILARHPELLWQQLYNRLQWEGTEIQKLLIPESNQRQKPGAKTWIRMKTKHAESKTLIRRLVVKETVEDCVFSLDGSLIICKCRSGFKVWDAITGAEVAEPINVQDLMNRSDTYSSKQSNKSPDRNNPKLRPYFNAENPTGISCENTTPKLFMDFMEGFLKISYPGPGRLTYKFWT